MSVLDGSIIGALIGGLFSLVVGIILNRRERKNRENHAASILYYDLKSIEEYISSPNNSVNIRYSNDWQEMVANCSFLDDTHVKRLYNIYDTLYNYNYAYTQKEKIGKPFVKNDMAELIALETLILDKSKPNFDYGDYNEEYEILLNSLKKHKKS